MRRAPPPQPPESHTLGTLCLQGRSLCPSLCLPPGAPSSSLPFTQVQRRRQAVLREPADGVGTPGTPRALPLPPFSGLRSYPLRGSHSLDDLLDRPGNSTVSPEYWDGQSRSRTASGVPSRAPSPAPTPLPGSRRSSVGGVNDVKVSPRLSSALGTEAGPGTFLCCQGCLAGPHLGSGRPSVLVSSGALAKCPSPAQGRRARALGPLAGR